MMIKTMVAISILLTAVSSPAVSQDMMDLVDLSTPEWSESDTTRAEIEKLLAEGSAGAGVDLTNRRLSGLDLSNLDFSGADMRWARLNNAILVNTNLSDTKLDLAWFIGANMENADLSGASLRSTQLRKAMLKGANFDNTRITANFKGADLTDASFRHSDLSADMKNQSMGLMGTVMTSTKLINVDFTGANLSRVDAEFARFNDAVLDDVNLSGSKLAGANLTGASVKNLDLEDADLDGTKLKSLINAASIVGLDKAQNLSRAQR